MKYLLLIYATEQEGNPDPGVGAALMKEYLALTQDLRDTGKYIGGERLQQASTATKVTVRDGKTIATDGPFAETREQLGGFYLVEAAHLDEAIAIAARIPSARFGTIEVRPIWALPASA